MIANEVMKSSVINAVRFSKLLQGVLLTFHGYPHIASLIVGLFLGCRPTAILRRVITIVVFAVDGVLKRWSAPHVFEEGDKAGPPSVTHLDTTSTVKRKSSISRIVTSAFRHLPRFVFWSRPVIGGMAMNQKGAFGCIFRKTTATSGMSGPKLVCQYDAPLSAVTDTFPMNAASTSAQSFNHRAGNESPESLFGEIKSHDANYN